MGASIESSGATSAAIKNQESTLSQLNDALKSDLAEAAVDVAGIVDPTPVSDLIGAGMSAAKGDWIGAGLSLISVIPYVGDALGKTAKGARLLKKMSDLKKRIEATAAALKKLQSNRKSAAAVERARRRQKAAERAIQKKKCQTCPDEEAISGKYGSRIPQKDGKWSGEPGNSEWHPDPNTERGKAILDATDGKPVRFKDGYPDFSEHSIKNVEIDMKGNHDSDFAAANAAAGYARTPKGYTWHHHEDGVTMQLVPEDLNKHVPHTGGNSIVNSPGY
jgi:hypothetical protein